MDETVKTDIDYDVLAEYLYKFGYESVADIDIAEQIKWNAENIREGKGVI